MEINNIITGILPFDMFRRIEESYELSVITGKTKKPFKLFDVPRD